jgi:hypothetical protein
VVAEAHYVDNQAVRLASLLPDRRRDVKASLVPHKGVLLEKTDRTTQLKGTG